MPAGKPDKVTPNKFVQAAPELIDIEQPAVGVGVGAAKIIHLLLGWLITLLVQGGLYPSVARIS